MIQKKANKKVQISASIVKTIQREMPTIANMFLLKEGKCFEFS